MSKKRMEKKISDYMKKKNEKTQVMAKIDSEIFADVKAILKSQKNTISNFIEAACIKFIADETGRDIKA